MSVVPLRAIEGGFDFDALFESLKGHTYRRLLIIGINGEGAFEWWGNLNADEAFRLMAKAQQELLDEEEP